MERLMNVPITFVALTVENSDDGKYVMPRMWNLKSTEIQME